MRVRPKICTEIGCSVIMVLEAHLARRPNASRRVKRITERNDWLIEWRCPNCGNSFPLAHSDLRISSRRGGKTGVGRSSVYDTVFDKR